MDERIQDRLESLAAEYAVTTAGRDHFALDHLDRYPGSLPFEVVEDAPTEATPEESLHLDPALIAAIASDLQRRRSQQPAADPLEALEEQLDAIVTPSPEPSTPSPTEESLPPPIEIAQDEPQHAPPLQPEDSIQPEQPAPQSKRPLIIGITLSGLLLIIGATVFYLLRFEQQQTAPTTETQKPTTATHIKPAQQPKPDSLRQTPPTAIITTDTIRSMPSDVKPSASRKQSPVLKRRDQKTPIIAEVSPAIKRSQPGTRSSINEDNSDVTIVTPPPLEPPPPRGKFVLQVCSTPSYAEAVRWKSFVDRRGNFGATIVKHQVREQTYYRVRIGTFTSSEEALDAAARLGLNTAAVWIVRIE